MTSLQQAIGDIREARESHVLWAKILRDREHRSRRFRSAAIDEIVGTARIHREWVKKYDRILRILRSLRSTARRRRAHPGLGP